MNEPTSKIILSLLPGIAASVATNIIPRIIQEIPKEKQTIDEIKLVITVALMIFYMSASASIMRRIIFNPPISDDPLDEIEIPEGRKTWTRDKLHAFSNWEFGNWLGNVLMASYQFSLIGQGYGSAVGVCIGILSGIIWRQNTQIMPSICEFVKAAPEEKKLSSLIRKVIKEAIHDGLLKKEVVDSLTNFNSIQNLIILNSLIQSSTEEFAELFSKLLNSDPSRGLIIDQGSIKNLQNRLAALSEDDMAILERKLALDESTNENPEVQELFILIAEIAQKIWYKYRNEIQNGIQNYNITAFYVKFMELLAGR